MTSWTSLSFGVLAFGMMPSVAVHGSTRRHPRDPANRLSAAGFRKALRPNTSRLGPPGGHAQQRSFRAPKPVLSAGEPKFFGRFRGRPRTDTREGSAVRFRLAPPSTPRKSPDLHLSENTPSFG